MRARLLFPDRDFDWAWALEAAAARQAARTGRRHHPSRDGAGQAELPWNAATLTADLGLDTLFREMARDDDCIFEVARSVILNGVSGDIETIRYRQAILRDCIAHPAVVRELYALAVAAMGVQSKHYLGSFMARYPDSVLRWSIETLEALFEVISRLRKLTDSHGGAFRSDGWTRFFATLRDELDDAYLADFERHLQRLRLRNGLLLSARLDAGNKGTDYRLQPPPVPRDAWLMRQARAWLPWLFVPRPAAYCFTLHPRDENGFKALATLKNRGIAIAADTLGQATDHVRNFFRALRVELAFYVGCLNLHERLTGKGAPLCLPAPAPVGARRLSCRGLYDVCLALNLDGSVVGNDTDADGKDLVVVTGANQGGKSTFLRSVGLAQLMMQSGLFVPAERFGASVCDGLFTHYKREEDGTMESGKLDEELKRMSDIVDHLTPHPVILFNESFAATNEREGSEIARQITTALLQKRIRMVFVTHHYQFAHDAYEANDGNVLFLRAGRRPDGTRTFKLVEGPPLQTSYGEDLYRAIFGEPENPVFEQETDGRRRRVG